MIRSSLKDIKKAIKNIYKSPFKVSSYNEELEGEMANFVVIEDINNRTLARFQYLKEDGAIISGYNDSPLYKKEREQHFPEYYDAHRRGVPLIDLFSFLGNSGRSDTAIGLQYYLNAKSEITPRMKIEFSFRTCGSLIIYYDYSTKCFHFGDVTLIEDNTVVILDDKTNTELFNIKADDSFCDDEHLNSVFTYWMLEMGGRLNKEFFIAYEMNELIEPIDKNKVLEHLKLIKMALI